MPARRAPAQEAQTLPGRYDAGGVARNEQKALCISLANVRMLELSYERPPMVPGERDLEGVPLIHSRQGSFFRSLAEPGLGYRRLHEGPDARPAADARAVATGVQWIVVRFSVTVTGPGSRFAA